VMINVYNIDILTRPDIEVQAVVLTASCGIYSFGAATFVTLRFFRTIHEG
jgi:hypothetical protein